MSEENEQKCKTCRYCGNYEGYYIKSGHNFESIKQGYCKQNRNMVASNFGCDCWRKNTRKINMRKRVATRALYEILTDISAIRQILQESLDDGENS